MTFTERRQRVTDPGILIFLEVTSDAFTAPLYLVADTQDWSSNGQLYLGVPFGFQLPDDVSGSTPRARLVMDNVGRGIGEELERLGPQDTVMAKIMISDRADPNLIQQTFFLPMTAVTLSGATASAQCGVDFLMRQQAVQIRANPYTLPGIFT